MEQVEVDDDDDGADVSDEDEAMDIDPHDIDHAKERGTVTILLEYFVNWCTLYIPFLYKNVTL